ncbi:hypothetical protein LTR62_006534 [Meristemomyces frigidus]|uniref:Uncharacterized protein n=1 Tax=Meristemomyces frigidus TaxID=1508187 RepID=A0AAN7TG56_9PEZI|nr:hypothetical protein LTR62_006534 [Meristemomyces frigidus]
MGRAYSPEQREHVRSLLEAQRDEEAIEKETGVSERTIRRWKMELERTGRIGKPPESRTGRHRVLSAEIEKALFDQVLIRPEMSVDDMLWWLYETHQIVVGTRTIRRVFERKGDKVRGKSKRTSQARSADEDEEEDAEEGAHSATLSRSPPATQYQSPYAAMVATPTTDKHTIQPPQLQCTRISRVPMLNTMEDEEDEEMLQLQLQQIALQKQEVELKLRLRRLQALKGTPVGKKDDSNITPSSTPSTLYNPSTAAVVPTVAKRDSRSKKKILESKQRTAERHERMLRELERRSRRRDHLTAEWVMSKDIWPLRAQRTLANLMHQYSRYNHTNATESIFNQMYHHLYELVDLTKGDWVPEVHDEQLRDRMKRKMTQLRTKMQKTGEIIPIPSHRNGGDAYAAFQRAENFTGQAAGEDEGAEEPDVEPGAPQLHEHQHHDQQNALDGNHPQQQQHQHHQMHYEIPGVVDHGMGPYGDAGMMQQSSQYPMMPQPHQHGQMMPYNLEQHGQHSHQGQDGMVL